jgi:glutamate racemase
MLHGGATIAKNGAMNPAAPLLIFDSGVGGLSVLAPTRALLPNAPMVYAADNAAFPYGTRSEAEIAARVPALLGRLVERYRPRLAVIACNTASTIALDHVRAALDIPVVGTVPAIKPAAEISRSRVIGVLGTEATVRQPYVDDLAAKFAADCTLIRHGSPELVALAEAKLAGERVDPSAVRAAIKPMLDAGRGKEMDVAVLACTHFPLLFEELAEALPGVALIDGGPGIARRIGWLTSDQAWPAAPSPGIAVFTGSPPGAALRQSLARFGLEKIQSL